MKKLQVSKFVLAIILAAMLLLSACSSAATPDVSTAPPSDVAPAASSEAAPADSDNPWQVSSEPITVTGYGVISPNMVGISSYNEIPAIQRFSEVTNLYFDWVTMATLENQEEQLSLSFASRNMPEIYTNMLKDTAIRYGEQGALVDLMPLIKEHAPNILAALQKDPSTIPVNSTEDGKLFVIQQMNEDYRVSSYRIFNAQYAWLDKLGLKAPETLDELYDTLVAFRDNAAQLTDEKIIPYTTYFTNGPGSEGLGYFDVFGWPIGMYSSRGYLKDGENKLVFGALQPEFVETMQYVRKLYAEGLMDPDLDAVRDDATFEAKMTNNRVGIAFVGQGRFPIYNSKAGEAYDDFRVLPMLPLKNKDGVPAYGGAGGLAGNGLGFSISVNCADPVAVIKALDYSFSPEGQMLFNFGIEGDTYEMVNGQPEFTDKIVANPDMAMTQAVATLVAPSERWACVRLYDYIKKASPPELDVYSTSLLNAGGFGPGVRRFAMGELPIPTALIEEYAVVQTDLFTYLDESIVKFIRGDWNLDSDYDNFTATLKNMRVDDYMQVLNDAYAKL
ncbi:MAG: extracellular solute-binding protein [Oscillospiraceae bacterium]|nr:extracellular solute-binding protein [Oscillospiraceae bacterium]